MSDPSTTDPYRPPQSDLTEAAPAAPTAEPAIVDYPGFGVRAGARIIDMVLGQFIALGAGVFAGITLAILQAAGATDEYWAERVGGDIDALGWVGGIMAGVTYHAVCEGIHGASIGKAILGLRVVGVDNRVASFGGAVIRSFAFLIDSLFFGLVAYSVMKDSALQQRLGDRWGKTKVMRKKDVPHSAHRSEMRLIGAIVLGVILSGAIHAAALIAQAI